VNDTDCTAFLQWALLQLDLRWPGFRKVRRKYASGSSGA